VKLAAPDSQCVVILSRRETDVIATRVTTDVTVQMTSRRRHCTYVDALGYQYDPGGDGAVRHAHRTLAATLLPNFTAGTVTDGLDMSEVPRVVCR